MFADPALQQRRIDLRARVDVDAAAGVARRLDRPDDLVVEALIGTADDAAAVDRTVVDARETREQRIELGRTSEEIDLDAVRVVLVDQHAERIAFAKFFL